MNPLSVDILISLFFVALGLLDYMIYSAFKMKRISELQQGLLRAPKLTPEYSKTCRVIIPQDE